MNTRVAGMTSGFITDGFSPSQAHAAAIGSVEHIIQAQALTMSYDDAFVLISVIFLIATPAALLFVRTKKVKV